MNVERAKAFSDGVIAIIITIMVLEIKVPEGISLQTLMPLIPKFMSYMLSFIFVGIYWNNHHHLFHAIKKINARIMWSNLNLLFWLSLFPVATGWMGENHFSLWPVVMYGVILFLAALAYSLLVIAVKRTEGKASVIAEAIGSDIKGKLSVLLYLLGVAASFINPWFGVGIYIIVAGIWFIPDKRIERAMQDFEKS
ncbi:TMEM175 family protein [Pedobacter sp.]|uniref:TMEM175 family protein n=1 Tax=Pedobacter sp. TaxID=1411316 RepID=UPI003C44AD9E